MDLDSDEMLLTEANRAWRNMMGEKDDYVDPYHGNKEEETDNGPT